LIRDSAPGFHKNEIRATVIGEDLTKGQNSRYKLQATNGKEGSSMHIRSLITFLGCSVALVMYAAGAAAQHQGARTATRTDAQLIASAMTAAPTAVSKDAAIVAIGSDGKFRTLREGQGTFTCLPDDPHTPGHDPMCLDRNGLEWLKALLGKEKPPEGKIWIGYMLLGGSDASNEDPFATMPPAGKKWVETGPHVMIGGPGIARMLEGYPTTADDTRKPFIMFGGTPYEHVMLPVR
jgi:hypothetical protein